MRDNKGLKAAIPHNKEVTALIPETKHRTKTRKAVAHDAATAFKP